MKSLRKLRADRTGGWDERTKRQAPHKAFLLLSVIDGIEQGWITNNRVELSQRLIDTFFVYWNAIMGSDRSTTIALPFFHLQSSPFWTLRYKSGQELFKTSPSVGGLRNRIEYAELDGELFKKMQDPIGKLEVRKLLAETYFSEEVSHQVKELAGFNLQAWEYEKELESLVTSPFEKDWTHKKKKITRKVSQQVRNSTFSMSVRKYYNFTCALCKSRVVTPNDQILVQGAHIIPWANSGNDDIRNGLSLCPSHHWMFDHLMVTIRPNYTIWLSDWLKQDQNHAENTLEFKDREILLPEQDQFFPAKEALADHNERFEKYNAEN